MDRVIEGGTPGTVLVVLMAGEMSGWARALNYGDGWDGWIALNSSSAHVPIWLKPRGSGTVWYGFKVDVDNKNIGKLWGDGWTFPSGKPEPPPHSIAWGDDVIGWLKERDVTFQAPNPNPDATWCSPDNTRIISADIWGFETARRCGTGLVCEDFGVIAKCVQPPQTPTTTPTTTVPVVTTPTTTPTTTEPVPPPPPPSTPGPSTFNLLLPLVRQNEAINITWDVDSNYYRSCRIEGASNTNLPNLSPQGSGQTNPITTSGSTFRLYCTRASDGIQDLIDEKTIDVIPSIYES